MSKKTSKSKNVGGRPTLPIDLSKLPALIKIQCTAEECAAVLGCSPDTLDRRLHEEFGEGFAEYRKRHLGEGRASLRRLQWRQAQDGNTTMLIWLGKQYLGQKDKHEHAGDPNAPLVQKVVHEVVD